MGRRERHKNKREKGEGRKDKVKNSKERNTEQKQRQQATNPWQAVTSGGFTYFDSFPGDLSIAKVKIIGDLVMLW